MSSDITAAEWSDLVKRAVAMTLGESLRGAGALLGVSQTTVKAWRDWSEDGSDPSALPEPKPVTVQGVRHYLAIASDIEARQAALRIAADRLEELAGELRREARSPSAADDGDLAARVQLAASERPTERPDRTDLRKRRGGRG